jgi:hypothetical protein
MCVRYPRLWYYGKITHSFLLAPVFFAISKSDLMSVVFMVHIVVDIFTHKTQDTAFYIFPINLNLPQLGIFNWGHIQEDTRQFVVHPMTYVLWAGLLCGLFLKLRIF